MPQGDEEDAGPKYIYEGERAEGATIDITAGEAPKVMTKPLQLLGERSGTGKATFPQGDVYEGSYAGGLRDGQGKYSYAAPPPGEDEEPKPPLGEYDGRWVAGEKSGTGTMMYASGAKYQGSWKNGKYEGEGTLFYPNGDIYSGQWMGGKKHGDATYFFKETGAKIKGVWSYGILSSGTFTDKFGNQYAGAFSGSAEAVGFVAGGTFSMASGATEVRSAVAADSPAIAVLSPVFPSGVRR